MHTAGHTHMIPSSQIGGDSHGPTRRISTPRTTTSHPNSGDGLRVPRSALFALREHLRKVYPKLAERPWVATRICWCVFVSRSYAWVRPSFVGFITRFGSVPKVRPGCAVMFMGFASGCLGMTRKSARTADPAAIREASTSFQFDRRPVTVHGTFQTSLGHAGNLPSGRHEYLET